MNQSTPLPKNKINKLIFCLKLHGFFFITTDIHTGMYTDNLESLLIWKSTAGKDIRENSAHFILL